MNIESEIKLDFADVLIRPKRSTLESRSQVNLVRDFVPKYGKPFSGVPIMAANMATGTFEMLKVFKEYKMFVAIAKFLNNKWEDEYINDSSILQYGFYTIGMNYDELSTLVAFSELVKSHGDDVADIKICVDIANGYTQRFANFVADVRKAFPHNVIIAGNVATPEMAQELIINGADYVKAGIGPGSHCSTRRQTGIGYPQLSSIIECADAAHGLDGGIVADGGVRTPGDVSKALCANADMVMIGGMFSGTDECYGDVITKWFENPEFYQCMVDGHPELWRKPEIEKKYKVFYGMSSEHAQEAHMGGMKGYRASEGVVSEVEYKGSVEAIVKDLLGSLRSTGTYIGANLIKNFGKCATFIRTNRVHDRNV